MKNDPTGPAAEGLPSVSRRQAIKSLAGGAFVGLTGAAIVATTSCAPSEAPAAAADPLLALIREYRTQLAIYNASGDQPTDVDNALAAVTMDPPWFRLRDECPVPTTMEGAIEGVRLVTAELRDGGYGGIEHGVLAAVVAFFEGRAA